MSSSSLNENGAVHSQQFDYCVQRRRNFVLVQCPDDLLGRRPHEAAPIANFRSVPIPSPGLGHFGRGGRVRPFAIARRILPIGALSTRALIGIKDLIYENAKKVKRR